METMLGPVLTRRQVMGVAGAAVAARMVSGFPDYADPTRASAAREEAELTLARFAPFVGTDLALKLGALNIVRVTLVEALARDPHPGHHDHASGEAFSLLFAGRGAKRLDHGTYTLVHPRLGAFPLFLVAVGVRPDGQRYQAIVDRRTPGR